MGQGYEDHLVTQEADIPEVDRVQWRKIDAQLYCLSKEEFLTVMPLTPDVGAQQTQLDKFFMVLTLIGLRPDLESIRDQILGSSSVPSLDDFLKLPLEEDAVVPEVEANVLIAPIAINLATLRDRCYQVTWKPPRTAHMAQSSDSPLPQPPSSSASQTSQASIASVAQPGNASACLTHTSSLGPWILDSGASDHLSGNKDLFSSITTTSALPTVTLANGSQTVAKGPEYGKTIGIGRESQGLYHLTSDSSPAVCISTDAPLLIHNRLGHPSLSKFQKMRLNNRAKSPFELVHTDVWGPCRTASTLGFQYFVTFIDDYSRSQFTSFMSHHGILHQSSCAHTPQQNGVAERKNRHLVETARTLLLHSNIPHSLSFPDQPLYFLPPRVFGCTCFVHILTPGQDKLSAKAMKCLFLGYSRLQKGYRCYSLETHHTLSPLMFIIVALVVAPLPFAEAPADSLPIPSASPAPLCSALCLLLMTYPLLFGKSTHEALSHPGWRQAMVDEMAALHSNGTWDLVVLPSGKSTVGCRWVYAVKVGPDGQVDRLKARLVAKGYTQVYGSDYGDTFSPVAKIASVRCFSPWLLCGESGLVCRLRRSLYGLKQSPRACVFIWLFMWTTSSLQSDQDGIQKLKQHLFTHFQTKDLGKLKYFLGIEIAQSSSGVVLSQRKYALDILEETGMLDCKPVDTPMDPNVKLVPGQGEPLGDPGRYRRLVGKLNYLTITRPDISFPVSVVSQFLQSPCDSHWDAVIRILRYIKSTPGQGVLYENRGHTQVVGYTDADWAGSPTDRRSTSGYCVFIGGNLISWKSKKQDVVARSSAEAEYRAMALATCELIWLRHLLQELRFGKDEQMKLICDNQAALHIASNPVFHERTKHIEVDCHFIREKIASGCVATSFVNSNDQLADIFTKSLRGPRIKYICNKLGAYDVYAPA
ncbi:Retrovirus-related Pol polyprotein from transposon RE2 [Vitis vinifera]|uniref:Retrovirus-related Pol polyprotein from transposon RE2 n=1 Tax=Vitis vinifera TaxID=29760 RepID=A0A438IUG9_VITVI|nr:Retrovirus-related Pol polyprotein from transposon RE2 [Vitis vinifera]